MPTEAMTARTVIVGVHIFPETDCSRKRVSWTTDSKWRATTGGNGLASYGSEWIAPVKTAWDFIGREVPKIDVAL